MLSKSHWLFKFSTSLIALAIGLTAAEGKAADYRNDVGYTRLSAELGAATPTGAGVPVTQVEADLTSGGSDYFPDTSNAEFTGKTLTPNNTPYTTSGHATTVGSLFYGNNSSMTPGITSVNVFDADDWLQGSFLLTGYTYTDGTPALPLATTDRVANHSYIGTFNGATGSITLDTELNTEALERLDYVVQHDNYINVVAVNNPGGSAVPLLAGSFNAISVGLTSGNAASGTTPLNGIYVSGRAAPDVVAPESATSYATPNVSSAAALLVQYAHANPSLSSGTVYSSRTGLTLEYAETADVIKAAIMAGADRSTSNVSTSSNITDYGDAAYATTNGLDFRYGAGQLDVYNSYHIIAAGQHAPTNAAGASPTATIGQYGFDYQDASANSAVEDYRFTGDSGLTATLDWNVHVDDSLNATLANFVLTLLQVNGNGTTSTVTSSASTIDNTQNLFLTNLNAADTYELEVSRTDDLGAWDYGLAWNLTPVPEPIGGAGMFIGLFLVLRRRNARRSVYRTNDQESAGV